MAAAVDLSYLSSYLSYPETSLNTVLYDPTTELVNALLAQVLLKAREHESIQSEKLKLEVELESAVHAADSKTRVLKTQVERAQKEATDLRQKLETEESSKNAIQAQLRDVQVSSTTFDSEASTLRARIASLEASQRDALSRFESKSAAHDELASELSAKHQKTVELRSQISTLEQSIQNAKTEVNSARSREQSLEQERDSLRRTNEWLDKELKTRSEEHTKFRKEKSARLSELQRTNEEVVTTVESLKRTEQTLRARLDEVSQKADDFLTQANELRDEANRKEEMFRAELDTANRLAELMKESCDTEKQRHQDLSEQLEELKENAAEEIGRIQAEAETEHHEREAAENRVSELEAVVERLEADAALMRDAATQPDPQTPRYGGSRRGTPGPDGTPSRLLSPVTGGLRGGISYTQVISDYHNAKAELETEKRRNQKLSSTIDEMINDMEARQPEILELQSDHKRLENEVLDMSTFVDSVAKERDEAKKDAKKWERQVQGLTRQGELLQQQLRDTSAQIKILVLEIQSLQQGEEAMTQAQRTILEQMAKGDLLGEEPQDSTDTGRYISEHLATFRNIFELQEQNSKLLRLTRELGDRMEGEEAQAQRSQASQNVEELADLRQKYERCKDEIQSLVTQSKSYMQERDMFRRMLSHRGQLPQGTDITSMFGQSINTQPPATPSRNGAMNSVEQSPNSKELADYAKLLKEMQLHFDKYRQEASADRSHLKDQLTDLTKKSAELRTDLSKKSGEVSLAMERYEMLQGNFNMLKKENTELQKRSQAHSERASVQEIRVQEVTENLVESRALLEGMRNETANLKAEKEFWKTIETRLVEDNKGLQADRDRLNGLNSSLQNLLNEREHSEAETRRRLQGQVEGLESELSATKRKLADEVEEYKRNTMRRDYESSQSQTQIDELKTRLDLIKEELAGVRATRDQLQAKVDEMTIELRSAEERLEVLQQRPANDTNQPHSSGDGVNHEQQLALEVSELKRDLDLAQGELTNARTEVEQYKAISQGSEEELKNLTETQEQYREEMDRVIQERENTIRTLEQNNETLREEITSVNAELTTLRAESAQHDHRLEDQKTQYEMKLAEAKDLFERTDAAAKYHQQDLKLQADIATRAQQNYDQEVMRHGEALKSIRDVREEYNKLKLEVVELKTSAETAQSQLSQGEETWNETKERYERELSEIRVRREDAIAQNKILHQQLEDTNKQIADLQTSRAHASDENGDEDVTNTISSSTTSDKGVKTQDQSNLNELIRYLRREKEIVDVQLELSSQEARRVRQQLEHTQNQLEETRLKLNQQRRAEEDSERQALNHKKLMETIEELNLNRESNSTLRSEKSRLQAERDERQATVNKLQEEIQPLQAKVVELEALNESMEQELRLAQEARARFEQRYLDILNRSDSIDPAEFEKVKDQAAALEEERNSLLESRQSLQMQVDAIPAQIEEKEEALRKQHQESREKIVSQAKERDRRGKETIREKDAAIQSVRQERDALQEQLRQSQSELERTRAELAAAQEQAEAKAATAAEALAQAQSAAAGKYQEDEDGEIQEQPAGGLSADEAAELQRKAEGSENQVSVLKTRVLELETEVANAQASLSRAEATVGTLQSSLQTAEIRASEAQQAQQAALNQVVPSETTGDVPEAVEQLQQELSQAKQEIETLKSNALVQESATNVQNEEGSLSIADQIAAQVEAIRAELTSRHEERVRQAEDRFNQRAASMKGQLSSKLQEARVQNNAKVESAVADITQKLKSEHEAEINELNARHKSELDELRLIVASSDTSKKTNTETSIEIKQEMTEGSNQTADLVASLMESELREIITKNSYARKMVQNSLTNGINKAKAENERTLAQKLAEAEKAKQQAVEMEGKRYNVKMNMAENRAKMAQGKLGVVERAAKETPEKAVSDVWEAAKSYKPAPAAPAASATATPTAVRQSQGTVQAGQQTASSPATVPNDTTGSESTAVSGQPAGQPSLATPALPVAAPVLAAATPALATPALPVPTSGPQDNPFAASKPAVNPFAQGNPVNGAAGQQQSGIKAPAISALSQSSHAPPSAQQHQHQHQQQGGAQASGLPTKKLPDQPLGAGRPGTALGQRSASSSGLPIPNAAAAGRGGSGIPQPGQPRGGGGAAQAGRGRGRGGGIGRGGLPQVNTGAANQSGQASAAGSPRGRQLSAQAQQFVPKKRTAEDVGLDGSVYASGGPEKKARGGGAAGS